jgi:hypothetical protein
VARHADLAPRHIKARRLLAEGRVRVACADGRLVAVVRGDTNTYVVQIDERGRPVCPCPSWLRSCSHVIAVGLVTESAA